MASLRQLANQIKTFNDFKKVINIQKIVVMKEIAERQKVIAQAQLRSKVFNNFMIELYKKHGAFHSSFFDEKKAGVPVKRNMHFIMSNPTTDRVGEYGNKLILDFIKKNNGPDDVYVVIGHALAKVLRDGGLNIISVIKQEETNSIMIYNRIAFLVLRGYRDLLFVRATFTFLNMITKQVEAKKIFPFDSKKSKVDVSGENEIGSISKFVQSSKLNKVTWLRSLEEASTRIARFAIEMEIYSTMVEYRLSMKMRELQSLDDKEKNIIEEIDIVKLNMQRVRKENVTNELLTNAVAFAALNEEEEEDE